MFYIIWALVTLASFGYFVYVVIIGGKAIRQKLGGFALLIFVLGLFSFHGRNKKDDVDSATHEIEQGNFTPKDSIRGNIQIVKDVVFMKTPISNYYIGCLYGVDKNTGRNTPINAFATMSGVQLGTGYKINDLQIEPTGNNKVFEYRLNMTTEWKLLGFTFFHEGKDYTGVIKL